MNKFTMNIKGNKYTIYNMKNNISYSGNRNFIISMLLQLLNEQAEKVDELQEINDILTGEM